MYIRGIDVILYDKTENGVDDFGRPIYIESQKIVNNVLPIQPTSDEVVKELDLTGKKISYKLCIPKGDNNDWENKRVEFFGLIFETVGNVTQYVDELVPLYWNKQIMVKRYE